MTRIENYRVRFIDEDPVPDEMKPGELLIHTKNGFKNGFFICPCGCGRFIMLTFDDKKGWKLSLNDDIPTISPSILRPDTCGSHFFIRQGKVIWC